MIQLHVLRTDVGDLKNVITKIFESICWHLFHFIPIDLTSRWKFSGTVPFILDELNFL